jgi:hypothetical protein
VWSARNHSPASGRRKLYSKRYHYKQNCKLGSKQRMLKKQNSNTPEIKNKEEAKRSE